MRKVKSFVIIEEQTMFNKPSKFSKPVALVKKGRLLLIKKCRKNWCQVETQDIIGWIETTNVWGKSLN